MTTLITITPDPVPEWTVMLVEIQNGTAMPAVKLAPKVSVVKYVHSGCELRLYEVATATLAPG